MSIRAFLLAAVLSASTLPAFADGEFVKLITSSDRQRMEKYGDTRKEALAEAKAGGSADGWRRSTRWPSRSRNPFQAST